MVNRTATFVFYLGDRYFGTLTALVPGEQAGQFVFTSSLATQILKTLLPKLQPHLYPQPPEPSRLKPVASKPAGVVAPAGQPVVEAPDDTTSKVDVPVQEPAPTQGGFPEDLEPGVTVPEPAAPTPAPPVPAKPASEAAPAPAAAPAPEPAPVP